MKLTKLTLYEIEIPLRFQFSHAQASYKKSHNFIVKCDTSLDLVGWGEGVARSFVTGEASDNVIDNFKSLPKSIFEKDLKDEEQALQYIKEGHFRSASTAISGALEMAILDSLGKRFRKSIASLFGASSRDYTYLVPVSAVIGLGLNKKVTLAMWAMKSFGLQDFKVKISNNIPYEIERFKTLQKTVGRMRLDANSSLTYEEITSFLNGVNKNAIELIEDPLEKRELGKLAQLQKETGVQLMLDESVKSRQEAASFCEQAPFAISVRIGKCGGFLNALELVKWCEDHRMPYQVGCHVGETGILSAAARQLLALSHSPMHVEGFYDQWLMSDSLTRPVFGFGFGGRFKVDTTQSGLGINVNEKSLEKYTIRKEILKGSS